MFNNLFKKHIPTQIRYREIDEVIAAAKSVLENAKEIAGKSQDSMSPEAFPHVAQRDGHKATWQGNAAVALAEEKLLNLEKLKAGGTTQIEIEYGE